MHIFCYITRKCRYERTPKAEEKLGEMKNVQLNDVISQTCKCLKSFFVNKTNGANMNR